MTIPFYIQNENNNIQNENSNIQNENNNIQNGNSNIQNENNNIQNENNNIQNENNNIQNENNKFRNWYIKNNQASVKKHLILNQHNRKIKITNYEMYISRSKKREKTKYRLNLTKNKSFIDFDIGKLFMRKL
ncbi:hypothetical protein CDIK_2558 [Cucumispora dikerogammari]|nr:hypothetical protein CDIK_2558 [Cucumispora dikerogammari]